MKLCRSFLAFWNFLMFIFCICGKKQVKDQKKCGHKHTLQPPTGSNHCRTHTHTHTQAGRQAGRERWTCRHRVLPMVEQWMNMTDTQSAFYSEGTESNYWPRNFSSSFYGSAHMCTHTHTRVHTHACTRTHTHTRTHSPNLQQQHFCIPTN